jgi:sugar phosphate isomerase/epimerase
MRFGISTHLYHDIRLDRAHLAEVAAYGFEAIEVFATRSHFDYHDRATILRLKQWLGETGLALHGIHAPITDRIQAGTWSSTTYSTAASDASRRQAAIREIETALQVAREIPVEVMVVHLGTPASMNLPGDNARNAAARSMEEIGRMAEPLGVHVAFEVIPNELSTAGSIVSMLEQLGEARHTGICLDFGHAHLMGDVADAIETAAEHLITTHVHDNHKRADDHLPPYRGSIEWDRALMSMQKIGYDGTYLFEVAGSGPTSAVLEETRRARQRFERTFAHP